MDKYKFWLKLTRVVVPAFVAGILISISLIMYNTHGAVPDVIMGVIVAGGMNVLANVSLGNHKQEEAPKNDNKFN